MKDLSLEMTQNGSDAAELSGSAPDLLRRIADICERAARGDLEARIVGGPADGDLGRVCRAINQMLDIADAYVRESAAAMDHCAKGQFHRPILERGLTGSYRAAAGVINRAASKMQQDAEQIHGFEVERRRVVERVQQATDAMGRSIVDADSASRVILDNADRTKQMATSVTGSADATATNITAVAAACEELTSTTNEISRQAGESAGLTRMAVDQAEQAVSAVRDLGEATRRIGSVVGLIQKIAGQTHLLALNATIEAARAGDHGRGFAVVANEVKVLSRDTADATDTIGTQIASMQDATGHVMKSIQAIEDSIRKIDSNASTISTAVQEQALATGEISERVAEVSTNTRLISTSIVDVGTAAAETGNAAVALHEAAIGLRRQGDSLAAEVEALSGYGK